LTSIYDFSAETLDGQPAPLAAYRDKVVLIVNTASKCGFTPQYTGLEKLWRDNQDKGLVILGFPCDQFGHQEPGNEEEIASFCSLTYGVDFPMFSKIEVNGKGAHPIYQWLRSEQGGLLGDKIKWNFTKFLVGKDGKVISRYGSTTKPEKLAGDIEKALASLYATPSPR